MMLMQKVEITSYKLLYIVIKIKARKIASLMTFYDHFVQTNKICIFS